MRGPSVAVGFAFPMFEDRSYHPRLGDESSHAKPAATRTQERAELEDSSDEICPPAPQSLFWGGVDEGARCGYHGFIPAIAQSTARCERGALDDGPRVSIDDLSFPLGLGASGPPGRGLQLPPRVTPDDVQREAEAQFNRAVFLLNQGDIIDVFLDPDPMTGRRSRDPAEAMGRPLREWQKEWNERYRLAVQTAWPTFRQAIEDESIDIALLKGYASEFLGRSYVSRVNDEYRRLESLFRSRRAQQYWHSCEQMGDLCGIVRDAVTARLPQGLLTTSWTGSRDHYRGSGRKSAERPWGPHGAAD